MTEHRSDKADDGFLDAFFDAARDSAPPPVDAALQARLLADAAAWQGARRAAGAAPLSGWQRVRQALADIGGLPGLASVAAAGVAGVWIGVAPPASAEALVGNLAGDLAGDLAGRVLYGGAESDLAGVFPGVGATDLFAVITIDQE